MSKPLILVADDHEDVRQSLALLLRDAGYEVATAASPAEVLSSLRQLHPGLVLLDLNYQRDTTSGQEGLALLQEIRTHSANLPVVVMTGWARVQLAVQAIQLGAADFLEKPWENDRVRELVAGQLALAAARGAASQDAVIGARSEDGPIFRSRALQEVLSVAGRVAAADVPVLLTGESGTGKSMMARWIHRHSPRRDGSFVSVNVGGLTESLFESELFGHVKGAFTDARSDRTGRFEAARRGTLFLDEIANITAAQQMRLLQVLEDGRFERVGETASRAADARIVAATNADLKKLIQEGRFREDLYFRLNTVELTMPPLRARREDVSLLASHYLTRFAHEHARQPLQLSDPAARALEAHDWPGNVRELQHVMQRAVLLARGESVTVADLRLGEPRTLEGLDSLTLEQAERYVIRRALEASGGDVAAAADKLGMSRSALYRRLEKLRG
jgi:DNA-binding NtrC family response regulator